MAKPRYRHAHQQLRKRWAPVVEAGEAYCAEPICKMRNRWITPGSKWHLAHDPTGATVIGVSHEKCNTSEGASRGNRMRGRKNRLIKRPPTANRWVL